MDDPNPQTSPSPTLSSRNGPEELGPFASQIPFRRNPAEHPEEIDSHPAYKHLFTPHTMDRVARIFMRGCCLADMAGTIRFSVCEGHLNVAITKGYASMVVAAALDEMMEDKKVPVATVSI